MSNASFPRVLARLAALLLAACSSTASAPETSAAPGATAPAGLTPRTPSAEPAVAPTAPVGPGPLAKDHAELHPAATDVYLEVTDMPSVWTAYEGAPLVRLLRDARVKAIFDGFGIAFDPSPRALAATGLQGAVAEGEVDSWLSGVQHFSFSITVSGPAGTPVGYLALVDFAEPSQAASLRQVLGKGAREHTPLSVAALPGAEQIVIGDEPDDVLWCAVVGSRLIVGSGSSTVDSFLACSTRAGAGFSSKRPPSQGFEGAGGTPVFEFVLARGVLDIIKSVGAPDDMAEAVALVEQLPRSWNPVGDAFTTRMRLVGDRFISESFTPTQAGAEPARPIEKAWLEPVPKEAMLVYSCAFDGKGLAATLRSLLQKDEAHAAALAAIEQKLGYGPERVLGRLGPGLTVYAMPVAGLGLPESRLWVDCDDPAAFQGELEALVAALGEGLPGLAVKVKPYKVRSEGGEKTEVPVATLTLPQGMAEFGPMLTISPSFAPVGKKLVFALTSMDVKSELKRAFGGEGDAIVAGADPLAERGFPVPAGAASVFVMDWPKLFGGLLGLTKVFASMQPDMMPFDVNQLPPPEIFGEYLKPTFSYTKPIAGGTYGRSEASFGAEVWVGLLSLVGVRAEAEMDGTGMGEVEIEEIQEEPATTPGGDGSGG